MSRGGKHQQHSWEAGVLAGGKVPPLWHKGSGLNTSHAAPPIATQQQNCAAAATSCTAAVASGSHQHLSRERGALGRGDVPRLWPNSTFTNSCESDDRAGKRRDRELRQLREELRQQATRIEESHAVMEVLRKRAADAQAAKSRAQQQAWKLRDQLQAGEESTRSRCSSQGSRKGSPTRVRSSQSKGIAPRADSVRRSTTRTESARRNIRIPAAHKPPRCPDASGADTSSATDESTTCSSVRSGCTVASGLGNAAAGNDLATRLPMEETAAKEADNGRHRWAWPGDVFASGALVRPASVAVESSAV